MSAIQSFYKADRSRAKRSSQGRDLPASMLPSSLPIRSWIVFRILLVLFKSVPYVWVLISEGTNLGGVRFLFFICHWFHCHLTFWLTFVSKSDLASSHNRLQCLRSSSFSSVNWFELFHWMSVVDSQILAKDLWVRKAILVWIENIFYKSASLVKRLVFIIWVVSMNECMSVNKSWSRKESWVFFSIIVFFGKRFVSGLELFQRMSANMFKASSL